MGAEIVSILRCLARLLVMNFSPRLFSLSFLSVPLTLHHGAIWQFAWNMAKTKTEACFSSGSRTKAMPRDNETVSFGTDGGGRCRGREVRRNIHMQMAHFPELTPPPQHTPICYQHTLKHTHTRIRHTYGACSSCSFIATPFQLINMFVSINRNYANYRSNMCVSEP